VTDDYGLPRFWATAWEALHSGGLSDSTLSAKLLAVDRFYRSVQEQTGRDCLDHLLADGDFNCLEACLEGFLVPLNNAAAMSGGDRSADWSSALGFVCDILERRSRCPAVTEVADLMEARLLRLDRQMKSLRVDRKAKPKAPRALPASVVEDLYQVADPASARNPFRSEGQRWRNFALFVLYLHQGLRRGEALVLPVDAVKEDFDPKLGRNRLWLDVTENPYEDQDPRYTAPGIKTDLSHRQIPVTKGVADIVQHYVDNYRGRQDHTFLFPSNRKRPLAVCSVNLMFDNLSAALSEAARRDLRNRLHAVKVTSHDCRHSCAVVRLTEFVAEEKDMEVALQDMRVFFGWSKSSEMPRHYARAFFEDRLITVWQAKYDDRVEMLRALRAIDSGALPALCGKIG
jgi:integrase